MPLKQQPMPNHPVHGLVAEVLEEVEAPQRLLLPLRVAKALEVLGPPVPPVVLEVLDLQDDLEVLEAEVLEDEDKFWARIQMGQGS